MARRGSTVEADGVESVDTEDTYTEVESVTPDESEEVDTVAAADGEKPAKEPKPKKEPARGELPEGYVTPVGLAKVLSQPKDGNVDNTDPSNWYHTDKNGGHEVRPQMVYSYKKNASKEDPFPIETVKDSLEKEREALKLADGLAWWDRKNERVAQRQANAAEKAAKQAERAAAKANSTTEAEAAEETVTEEAE
jgi:hypothetical protein